MINDVLEGRMKGIQTRGRKRLDMVSDVVVKNDTEWSKERLKIG